MSEMNPATAIIRVAIEVLTLWLEGTVSAPPPT
jgi:hypothetical protein